MKLKLPKIFVLTLSMIMLPVSSYSDSSDEGNSIIVESDDKPLKSLFIQLWGKLRNISPKPVITSADSQALIVTAGIRGAESVDDLLNPYWKDDLTKNQNYIDEIQLFSKGNESAALGDLEKAIISYESFLNNYPNSDLLPSAKFALGVAYSQFGEQAQAVRILSSFVDEYHSHLFIEDAKSLLELMI